MSGSIHIDEQKVWIANGWFYRSVLDEIGAVLSETGACPSLLDHLRDPHGDPQVIDYLDLRQRSAQERKAFRDAVVTAFERWRRRGCLDWERPDLFPKFMEHFEKLSTQLDDDQPQNAA